MPRPVVQPVASVFAALSLLVLGTACGSEGPAPIDPGIIVSDVGFMTPESVLHDSIADVYLVSNINGAPAAEDDNGFISRLTPDGQVETLKWIDGASANVLLNAPKGMAIRGDTLFVADIKCIRRYNRTTGESITSTCYDSMAFLNDIAVGGSEQSLWITDTGVDANFQSIGKDAVYRFEDRSEGQQGQTLASGSSLGGPNGVAVGSRGIFVVTFGSGEVLRFTPAGEKTVVLTGRQLDGVVITNDGGFAYSSWADSSVIRITGTGTIDTVAKQLDAPADIGYDKRRNRILVPLFNANEVRIIDLSPPQTTGQN